MYIIWWMDNMSVRLLHSEILLNYKKKLAGRWMELEKKNIILIEITETQTDKYCKFQLVNEY